MNIPEPTSYDAEVQADIDEPEEEDNTVKLRGLERIKLYPKVPPEPSAYGNGKSYSRPWILQDGREPPAKGSEMKAKYKIPIKLPNPIGIRKRMLTDFFWEQMLDEVIDELGTGRPVTEYCTEYDTHYTKENFEPHNLDVTVDKDNHLKYPLHEFGSSAITFYSQVVKKTGPAQGILDKFRRSQDFTKPMGERLDKGWVLYPFYISQLYQTEIYILTWLRYTLWIPLYPIGVGCEAVVLLRNIPYFEETQRFTVSLPNAWNFAFHMPTFLRLYILLLMCPGLYLVIHKSHAQVMA